MKTKLENKYLLCPMPITIVGTMMNGKVNFINVAHIGILNASSPHIFSIAINKNHYSKFGIKENKSFSINIPSQKQMVEVDYVGLVSGKNVDKSNIFEVFYGEVKTAPMVKNCPLSIECKLIDIYETKTHEMFIGEVINSYADDSCLTDGKVDLAKIDPLLFDMSGVRYWSLGSVVGKCWSEGKKMIQANK